MAIVGLLAYPSILLCRLGHIPGQVTLLKKDFFAKLHT